jgi:FemAB-related protein (PEP-CTERM system-associated)
VSVEILELRTEFTEWDTFVRTAEEGTPFHLIAWRQAVEQAFGLRSHYLMAREGSTIQGVLPLFECRGLLGGRALVSIPYAVYGGICATSMPARRALVEAATALARQCGAAYVELRQRRDQGLGLPTKSRYVTFSRTIGKSDEENALAIPRKQRRMTRQGEKHGLRAEIGRDHVDTFYEIYAHSLRNLGSPVFPKKLLAGVHEAFDKECQLLSIWKDDRMVAGVMTLFYEDQVLPYYGGAYRDTFQYAVNDFMYWELMRYAARSGYRIFDFGRSREGSGPYAFKCHWGFEPVPLPYQYILLRGQALPDLSPSNPRFSLAQRVWPRLPLPVTKVLGPLVTRYLP